MNLKIMSQATSAAASSIGAPCWLGCSAIRQIAWMIAVCPSGEIWRDSARSNQNLHRMWVLIGFGGGDAC
jgi:hypothetical protein